MPLSASSGQRRLNGLGSALCECYPGALLAFGTDLDTGGAMAVLGRACTPADGRRLRLSTLDACCEAVVASDE